MLRRKEVEKARGGGAKIVALYLLSTDESDQVVLPTEIRLSAASLDVLIAGKKYDCDEYVAGSVAWFFSSPPGFVTPFLTDAKQIELREIRCRSVGRT